MPFARLALAALLTLAAGSQAVAQALAQADVVMAPRTRQPALLDAYTAYIGHDDLFNSRGTRLTRPAAILRQDRANVHAYGLKQRGDGGDGFFGSQANRAAMERMVSAGRMSPAAARAIVDGGATVRVEVWGHGSVGDYIHVEVY